MSKRRIFVQREAVDVTDRFNAVGVDTRDCLQVLQHLESQGYQTPILHGGFLRDKFLRELRPEYHHITFRDFDAFTVSPVEPDDSPQTPNRARRVFKLGEVEIDLMHNPHYKAPQDAVKHASVALCSPAMGLDGRIWASSHFLKAASDAVYYPDSIHNEYELKRMVMYFNRLSQKIPGLALRLPEVAADVVEKLKDASLRNLCIPSH